MQTLKNYFIVTSPRTLRDGINPAAVLIKGNVCYRLFYVNCKYNTLRSKHNEEDQTCQFSLMRSIARSGS